MQNPQHSMTATWKRLDAHIFFAPRLKPIYFWPRLPTVATQHCNDPGGEALRSRAIADSSDSSKVGLLFLCSTATSRPGPNFAGSSDQQMSSVGEVHDHDCQWPWPQDVCAVPHLRRGHVT